MSSYGCTRVSAGAASSEGLAGAGGSTSKVDHSDGRQVLSGYWLGGGGGVSVPLPVCLTQDCSSTLLAWWLVFPRASAHCNAFYQKSHISNSLTFYWPQRGSPGSIKRLTTQGLECWLPQGPTCSPGFVGLCHAMRIHIKRVLGTFTFWLHPLP